MAIWLSDLQIGLGIWEGEFDQVWSHWLRWCDQEGNWLPTDTERERQAREQDQGQLVQAARRMVAGGMAMDEVVALLGLTEEQLRQVGDER